MLDDSVLKQKAKPISDRQLDDMLEKSVRLGANSKGAEAFSRFKRAFFAKHGTWNPKK